MSGRVGRLLQVAAVLGIGAALVSFGFLWRERREVMQDTGETRAVVESAVAGLGRLHPTSLTDPVFTEEAAGVARSRHVVYLWLVAPGGEVLFSTGGIARAGDSVERLATAETKRVLAELPEGSLDELQVTRILAASALQAEGEHNDVFRHMVRDVRGPDGVVLGFVGVTYEVIPGLSPPQDVRWRTLVATFVAGLGVYWLALPAWVYLDAGSRGERAFVWGVFVLLSNLVGLVTYLLVRRPA